MARTLIRDHVFSIIVFVLVIFAGVSMATMFQKEDADFINESEIKAFNNTFNQYQELSTSIGQIQGSVENETTAVSAEDTNFLSGLIRGSWNTLKFVGTSFNFMDDAFKGISTHFGIPAWVPNLIIFAIVALIVFVIWSAVFQREI